MEQHQQSEQHRQPELHPALELQTPRLILRTYTSGDLAAVHHFASDPRLAAYVEWGPNTLQDSRDFLAGCLAEAETAPRNGYTFAITHRDGGIPFGSAGLTLDAVRDSDTRRGFAPSGSRPGSPPTGSAAEPGRTGEVGYVIAADQWNRGYATEAAAAVVRFGLHTLGLERIRATCRPGNTASARVLEKTGLVLQERLPGHKLIRGQWEDSLLYSMAGPGSG